MDPEFNRSTRSKLHPALKEWFPADTVHDRIARALCEVRCLPRKEFFESWSFVHRVRRHLDAKVVWDLCSGHGLVGLLFALLEPDLERVVLIDKKKPLAHEKIRSALETIDAARVSKVSYVEEKLEKVAPPTERVFVTAVHACGRRTDRAIDLALASRSSIAVLPCCHDVGYLEKELPAALRPRFSKKDAVDVSRIFRLHHAGWKTLGRRVDAESTECAELILGLAPA